MPACESLRYFLNNILFMTFGPVSRHFVPCPLRNLPLRTRKLPVRTNVSYQFVPTYLSLRTRKNIYVFFLISSLPVDMFVMLYIICRPICIDYILQIGNYSESSEINICLCPNYLDVFIMRYMGETKNWGKFT